MEDYSRGAAEFYSLVEKEKKQIRILRKAIRGMAVGKLMVSNEAGGVAFYRIDKSSGRYVKKRISSNKRVVYLLAHKKFEEERLRRKENNLRLYERIVADILPDDTSSIIASLPKGYDKLDYKRIADPAAEINWPNPSRNPNIKPEPVELFISSMTSDEWASVPYCENTKDVGNKTHRSRRGLRCRSKGEVSLLDVADELGYRYRYDCVITIDGMEVSPDLIIIRPDGKLIFVEHHGWVDDASGDVAFLRKLWIYSRAGIVQGRNLLVTFDKPDGSADIELIRRQLQNMMEI